MEIVTGGPAHVSVVGEMMIKNAKAKGSRREREVRDIYISRNFDVVKAAGSLGMFDLVAIAKTEMGLYTHEDNIVLIQVKSTHIPPLEVQVISDHETVARKEVWIKKNHKPWMMTVIGEPLEENKISCSKTPGPC